MELDTNEALVRWMEDEGLSPFTLLKVTPKPTAGGGKPPRSVVMEWGLEDLEYQGDRERFLAWRVSAEEVTVFRCEGKLDRFEECQAELVEGAGIALRLEAGGTLVLACGRLVLSEGPVERLRKGRPRPHHGELNLELDLAATTWGELRGWLGIPTELCCLRHLTSEVLDARARPLDRDHAKLVDDAGHAHVWLSVGANRLHVSRGKWAADELWTRLWSLSKTVPGVTRISSRNLVSAPATWPHQPPPKPAPQVWPNVYGVTCDFAELTLDDLRQCLELSAEGRFVFNEVDAVAPSPTLRLAEAARHEGRRAMSGVFHSEAGKPLVRCRADLRESVLSFQRERACDDATWGAVWSAPERLPGVSSRHSRTTQSPPDPWPAEPPKR